MGKRKMKFARRWLSVILCLAVLFSVNGIAYAAEDQTVLSGTELSEETVTVEKPTAEEPAAEQPAAEEPTKEEPAEEPAAENPEKVEPMVEAPAVMSLDGQEEAELQAEAQNGGSTVTVELLGYKEGIGTATVTLPEEYHALSEYGFNITTDPGEYTVLHALAEYEVQQYGLDRADAAGLIEAGPTGFVSDIEGYIAGTGMTDIGWSIWKDGSALYESASNVAVSNGSHLTFAAGWWFYSSSTYISTSYCRFTSIPTDAKAGRQFDVTLSAVDTGNTSNPAGITISALDSEGNEVAKGVTNAQGTAKLRIAQAGEYRLTAVRYAEMMSEVYYTDSLGGNAVDITIPWGSITVAAGDEMTDEEAVSKIASELSVPYQVTENLSLSAEADYGVQIQWTSSDESVCTSAGKITRTVMKDNKASLTAVVTRGDARQEKIFTVIVKGYELLDSLTVTPGVTAEKSTYQSEYIYYIAQDTKSVTLKVKPSENATMVMGGGIFSFDSSEQTKAIDVSKLAAGGEQTIELKIYLGQSGNGTVKVHIKKYGTPAESLGNLDSAWGQHLGDDSNNAVVDIKTPTDTGELVWESLTEEPQSGYGTAYAGHPVLVNGKIYVVRNNEIQILNQETGVKEKSAALASATTYYAYPTYGEGKIFVPLGNGSAQCFDALTLESLFILQCPLSGVQGLSSIHYKDGMIYIGYSNGAWMDADLSGGFAAFSVQDLDKDVTDELIAPSWVYEGNGSYYGAGAVTATTAGGEYLVFAGDDGKIVSADPKTGEVRSEKQVSGKVRCSLVWADGAIWFTSQDGRIYKFAVGIDGSLAEMASAPLPSTTNASPVVSGGKVYITGGVWNAGYLQVFDTNLKSLVKAELEGPANTPTVTTAYGETYVYFTLNQSPDTLYSAKVTSDNKITLNKLYTSPEAHANYSMSYVMAGEDGTLYYGNDAGYLIAVKAGKKAPETSQTPSDTTPPASNQQTENTGKTTTKNIGILRTSATGLLKTESTQEISKSARIADAIVAESKDGKNTLTVTNVPDKLEADVFEELAKHKDFQLVLDCGTYTISIKGADVKNTSAGLSTKLVEKTSDLTDDEAAKLGKLQLLELVNDGALPGKLTIVYKLPEALQSAEELYLYQKGDWTGAVKVTIKNAYAMFTLEEAGEFVLSDTIWEETQEEANLTEGVAQKEAEAAPEEGIPGWLLVVCGMAAGIAIGAVAVGVAAKGRKKKEDTWES